VDSLDRLQAFKSLSLFKRVSQTYIVSQVLEKDAKKDLTAVFKEFDKNGDGKLSIEEVMNGYLDHYGKVISEREVKQIFSEVDFEKNGAIGYTEFIIATIS
jgi:Ca2+-binding EF-hand superfamily protein